MRKESSAASPLGSRSCSLHSINTHFITTQTNKSDLLKAATLDCTIFQIDGSESVETVDVWSNTILYFLLFRLFLVTVNPVNEYEDSVVRGNIDIPTVLILFCSTVDLMEVKGHFTPKSKANHCTGGNTQRMRG